MMSNVKKKDVPLISISLVAILFIAAALSLFPQQSADAANAIYTFVTRTLGSAVQVLVLLAMGLVIYLATSKYGNIRLGEGKPEYSTLSWLFMFICAGLGSSTLYWGVAEWAYYYQTPGLNIAPRSQQALMNPLMILVKIIKLRWIHILSYDQMVSRKINNQTTRCANSI
ncbi:BCCT family transporter, partial [Escherichia coli]